jgi:hypothetical protein
MTRQQQERREQITVPIDPEVRAAIEASLTELRGVDK